MKKKGVIWKILIPLIIAIAIIIISFIIYALITGKSQEAIEFFNNLRKFGR